MAQKKSLNPLTPLLQERANLELAELNKKLQKQLRQDISRIYSESLFPDLEIVLNGGRVKTHSCIAQARVPNFLKEITEAKSSALAKLNHHVVESFVRQIYSHNVIKHKEDAIVAQIHKLGKGKKCDPGSPDSDVFITPKDSPLEVPSTYRGGKCNFPKPEPELPKKSSHYYNLVHLEEEFNSLSSDGSATNLLERELAEQDQLFKSFHSIIIKENQDQPKKPNPEPKKKSIIAKPVKRVNPSKKFFVKHLKNEYIDCGFDSEYLNLEASYRVEGMSNGEEKDVRGEAKQEAETNGGGGTGVGSPRSGASSPSVTWDSVLQDVPSGFVMPPAESSRSDDAIVPIGVREEPIGAEEQDPMTSSSCEPLPKKMDSPIKFKEKPSPDITPSVVEKPQRPIPPPRPSKPPRPPPISSVSIQSLKSTDQPHLTSELCTASPPASPASPRLSRSSKPQPAPTTFQSVDVELELKTEALQPVKTNYFIDASNLHDDDESHVSNLSVDYIIQSSIDFEPKEVTKEHHNSSYHPAKKDCLSNNSRHCNSKFSIDQNTGECSQPCVALSKSSNNEVEESVVKSHPQGVDLKCVKNGALKSSTNNSGSNDTLTEKSLFLPISDSKPGKEDVETPDSLNNDKFENGHDVCENGQLYIEDVDFDVSVSRDHCGSAGDDNISPISKRSGTSPECTKENGSVGLSAKSSEASSRSEENNPPVFMRMTSKDIESIPIVSGRASISDFIVEQPTASPRVRRKTETAPILSGAAAFSPEPAEERPVTKIRTQQSLNTSWTIDMSDSQPTPEPSPVPENKRADRNKNSGFGFFIPLDEPKQPKKQDKRSADEDETQSNLSSSCGFYIDLKNDFESIDSQFSVQSGESESLKPEKKLFSMFIDISDSCSKSSDSASPKSKTSSPFLPTRRAKPRNNIVKLDDPSTSLSSDSGLDMGEHPEVSRGKALFATTPPVTSSAKQSGTSCQEAVKKPGFFMFIEANESSKVTRRKNLSQGMSQSVNNRHSWNSDLENNLNDFQIRKSDDHKRANSLSIDKVNFENNSQLASGPASVDCVHPNKLNGKNRMLSSWHGSVKPSLELSKIIKNSKNKENGMVRENSLSRSVSEKGDKDDISVSTKSDEVFDSKASISSHDNRTFVLDDVSKQAQANSSELEASTSSHDVISDLSKDDTETDVIPEETSLCSNRTEQNSAIEEAVPGVDEGTEMSDSFVRLSDMDKVITSSELLPECKRERKLNAMSRSIPDSSTLKEPKIKCSTSRSLSRLFPHLSFQNEPEESPSFGSLQSSCNPSLDVSAEPTGSGNDEGASDIWTASEISRLGADLLRIFLDEVAPDVVVEVGGRRIRAHKCILSSRCQYFAAMLSGGWVESAGNVISLQGFSYNTVHFALCYIYSGASNIPETLNIVELATLADMLCLEGLKDVITYTLKVKYCHFFHKPCSDCIVGVVECLPVAAAYGLDEIYRKSLRWISKHYARVWPTKAFAALPKELHDKCYKQHIVHMNVENILETLMGCEKLEATIPNVRWAQPICTLNTKLQETCQKYLANHFNEVLSSNTFLSLSREDSWTVSRLEEILVNMCESLQADQACLSYGKLHAMAVAITPQTDFKLEFVTLIERLEKKVEEAVVRQAGRAARSPAWTKLEPALRRRVQEAACLVFAPGDTKRSTVLNMQQKSITKSDPLKGAVDSLERSRSKQLSRSATTSSVSSSRPATSTMPKTTKSGGATSKSVVRSSSVSGTKSKLSSSAAPSSSSSKPAVTTTSKPAPQKKAVPTTTKSNPNKTPQSNTPSPLLKSKNNKFAQVKSRYLEPKTVHKPPEPDPPRGRRTTSSSDSSRTNSPLLRRTAMSTDSLDAPPASRRSLDSAPSTRRSLPPQRRPPTQRSSTFTKNEK